MISTAPDLSYTGEFNVGGYTPDLGVRLLRRAVQLTTDTPDPFYHDGADRAARCRVDCSVRKSEGTVGAEVVIHDDADVVLSVLTQFDATRDSKDHTVPLRLPSLVGTEPFYLGVRLTGSGSGATWEGFFRLVPYGQFGWEGVTLVTEETMRLIEDDLFNESFYPNVSYDAELRRAKADVRFRLIEAGIEPDSVWSDGVVAAPLETSPTPLPQTPSGIGLMVVPSLVLPTTYKAIAHAYARKTGYTDGRLADKADYYNSLYDDAMRGAVKSLIAVNDTGGVAMKGAQERPHRTRVMVS